MSTAQNGLLITLLHNWQHKMNNNTNKENTVKWHTSHDVEHPYPDEQGCQKKLRSVSLKKNIYIRQKYISKKIRL